MTKCLSVNASIIIPEWHDSASTAQPAATSTVGEEGVKDPADVWEFTEGDLDNIGRGATSHVSDDEWSYASVRSTSLIVQGLFFNTWRYPVYVKI